MSRTDLTTELIIPSYKRLDSLQGTLRSLRRSYPDLPVCLGIQGEIPPGGLFAAFPSDPRLRVVVLSLPSTTRTLNHCITSSTADVILILDDDAVPCPGWLEAHQSAFLDDPGLAYTSGREIRIGRGRSSISEWVRIIIEWCFGIFLADDKKLNGRIIGWTNAIGLIFGNFDQTGSCLINTPRGCNMAVRKQSFLDLGGFQESYRGNAWGFEADLGIRFAKRGKYGRYIGDAIVIHKEIRTGGSRQASKRQWFSDFLHNHRLLIANLGMQAWVGALPRLAKRAIWLITGN